MALTKVGGSAVTMSNRAYLMTWFAALEGSSEHSDHVSGLEAQQVSE